MTEQTATIRRAQPADIEELIKLRLELFASFHDLKGASEPAALEAATRAFFEAAFVSESSLTWVADVAGRLVASGTVVLFLRPPFPGNLSPKEGYVFNMFTRPAYRRRGIARQMVDTILVQARALGFGKLWLHASDDGRDLYAACGFAVNPTAMELTLS